MRKIAMILAFTLAMLGLFAQNDSEHLKFMGIPINGSHKVFAKKMEKKGFKKLPFKGDYVLFKGEFASSPNTLITVHYSTQKDLVYKVLVMLSALDVWSAIENDYFQLKSMLTQKYGKPSESIETFDSEIQPTTDNDKMCELTMGRCQYCTLFRIPEGIVELAVFYHVETGAFIRLQYLDYQNCDIIATDAMEDL